MPRGSGCLRHQRVGNAAEQVSFGASCGKGETDAAGVSMTRAAIFNSRSLMVVNSAVAKSRASERRRGW